MEAKVKKQKGNLIWCPDCKRPHHLLTKKESAAMRFPPIPLKKGGRVTAEWTIDSNDKVSRKIIEESSRIKKHIKVAKSEPDGGRETFNKQQKEGPD